MWNQAALALVSTDYLKTDLIALQTRANYFGVLVCSKTS